MKLFFALLFILAGFQPGITKSNTNVDVIQDDTEYQDNSSDLNVFIDCKTFGCDFDFFRREMPFLNYVRNRQDADLHILITSEGAGSGGRTFYIEIIGMNEFLDSNLSLSYEAGPIATDDEVRSGLTLRIKTGVLPYLLNRREFNQLDLTFDEERTLSVSPGSDPWNLWVFRLSVDGDLEFEQQSKARQFETEIEANRTSEGIKIDLEAEMSYQREDFDVDEGTIQDEQWENELNAIVVGSLNDHWSAGGFSSVRSSTFNNYYLRAELMPAIEYNLFPYHESSRKQLLFMYRAGINVFNYREETIFDKTEEQLLSHALNIAMEINQPWGEIRASIEGSNYLHDFTKNRLEIFGDIEVNLFRGFSLNVRTEYTMIRDQLNLPKGGASRDDILLQRRELATDYEFEMRVGISYTFGSVSNNIVNPRFGI